MATPLFERVVDGSPLPPSLVKLVSEAQAQEAAKKAAERRKAKARQAKREKEAREHAERTGQPP